MSRIIQILVSFAYGDAIGNHTIAIYNALKNKKIETHIYAENIDSRLQNYADSIDKYANNPDDIIIYHLSTGTELNYQVAKYAGKLIINYHNITPAKFFKPYSNAIEKVSAEGYKQAKYLATKADMVIADSDYNAQELRKMGYKCPIYTVPIIMDFSDYKKKPDKLIMNKFSPKKGIKNIVFVGRISPNKKQEDIILDFYYYTKYFNPDSRLILVGNYNNMEKYYLKLRKFVRKLGLNNVIFTGHVKFSEILAYYRTADLFLCESEHEGFCVPLVEAMYFKVPIIAYDSSAIGETLGDAGILLKEKKPKLTASIMNSVINDSEIQKLMKYKQSERLKDFSEENSLRKLFKVIY